MPTIEELQAQLDSEKTAHAAAKAELDKLKKPKDEPKDPPKDPPKDDPKDLLDKAKKDRQSEDDKKNETKTLEGALQFNMHVESLVKDNEDILPSQISDILKTAGKEKYDSAIEKANALKSAIVQSFFAIESNKEALTSSQKTKLEDYLKLTKTGKEDEAGNMYENLFEPALQTLKKLKKAEELGKQRSGFSTGNKVENDYKERLMNGSKKVHLKEKGDK